MTIEPWRRFRFVPMDDREIRACSFGAVKRVGDLYDPRIFGATRDLACECGKYVGQESAGIICDLCGVKVVTDSAEARRRRMGHIALSFPVPHPFGAGLSLRTFPVAPVHRRRTADGAVTRFGQRYEVFVEANRRTADVLQARGATQLPDAASHDRPDELEQAIAELVGIRNMSPSRFDADDLLSLAAAAFDRRDADLVELIRSCALTLRAVPYT